MSVDQHNMETRLRAELEVVTSELKGLGIHNPEVPEDWITTPEDMERTEADPNIGADRVEEWAERRGVLAELETRYNSINRALAKITNGTYGICEINGEPIEDDRLEANPAARTCKAHMHDESSLSL